MLIRLGVAAWREFWEMQRIKGLLFPPPILISPKCLKRKERVIQLVTFFRTNKILIGFFSLYLFFPSFCSIGIIVYVVYSQNQGYAASLRPPADFPVLLGYLCPESRHFQVLSCMALFFSPWGAQEAFPSPGNCHQEIVLCHAFVSSVIADLVVFRE